MNREIGDEPALCWWILYTLWNRENIIYAINFCDRKETHKYRIEVTASVDHAKSIY